MKTKLLSPAGALVVCGCLLAPLFASAEDTAPGPRGEGRPSREEVMKQFDANGDGKLDQAERQTMRAAMEARREKGPGGPMRERAVERFDKDGDGILNDAERAEADAALRAEIVNRPHAMERVDTDKDGKISDAEWAAARAAMRDRAGGPGPKGPGKPKGDKAGGTR